MYCPGTCVLFTVRALIKLWGYSSKQDRQGSRFWELCQSNTVWKGKQDPNSQFLALPTPVVSERDAVLDVPATQLWEPEPVS